ncbi:MAG: hypothetical protein WBV90_08545, partial [Terrimicrobiaceae bacterium]
SPFNAESMMESIKNRVLKRASGLGLEVSDRHPRIARPDVFPPASAKVADIGNSIGTERRREIPVEDG